MVKVLFDHNMPPAIARALHEIIQVDGHSSFALRDKFSPRITDIDYFTELGNDGNWIVISKDTNNAKRRAERDAIMRSGVLAFYLRPSVQKQRMHEQAATIIWHWENILQQRNSQERGMFELPVGKGTKRKGAKFRAI